MPTSYTEDPLNERALKFFSEEFSKIATRYFGQKAKVTLDYSGDEVTVGITVRGKALDKGTQEYKSVSKEFLRYLSTVRPN